MTGSMRFYRSTQLLGRVLAVCGALLGLLMIASTHVPTVAHLMYHFGLSQGDAVLVVSLVGAATWVLFTLFPELIPFIGTIRLILIFSGTGAVVGW